MQLASIMAVGQSRSLQEEVVFGQLFQANTSSACAVENSRPAANMHSTSEQAYFYKLDACLMAYKCFLLEFKL